MASTPVAAEPDSSTGVTSVRRRWAIVLCALGAVLLAMGTLAGVANRQVVDGGRFASHADEVRQDDAVSRQVGIAMTDAIIKADADLTAVRPLIEAASISIVRSDAFSPVVRASVRQVHGAFTEPGSGTLVLRLADVGAVLAGVIDRVAPDSSAVVPPNLDVTLARIGDQSAARSTIAAAHWVSVLSWLLPLLALGALVGAGWLLGWRKSVLHQVGLAVMAAGALLVVLAGVAAVVAASSNTDSLAGALRSAVLHLALGFLWWPAAVLLGTGVVLRVLAVLEGDPADTFEWRQWLTAHPDSQRTRALRAATFLSVGAFAVLKPSLAVQAVAIVIGMAVLVIGVAEATRVATEVLKRRKEKHDGSVHEGLRHVWTTRALVLLPVVVVATLVLSLAVPSSRAIPGGSAQAGAIGDKRCNGHVELCNRAYNDVAYPSSHNSMSAADEPGWYLAEQPTGLVGQLKAGIRVLLIDTWYGQRTSTGGVTNAQKDKAKGLAQAKADFGSGTIESALRLRDAFAGTPTGPVEPYLCHGVCDIGATKLQPEMGKVHDWLVANPREVVTIFIEDSVSAADTAEVFDQAGLLPYVATHKQGDPWPTLGKMIDSGKRLVVLMQRDGGGTTYPWLLQGWDQTQDTNYDAKTAAQLSCARNRGTGKSQLLMINNWVNNFGSILTDAGRVNSYDSLYPRMVKCRQERGMIPNYIAVNYFDRGDLFKVVNAVNGVT